MENGEVIYGGRIPEKMLAGLVGDLENQSKLRNFLNHPIQLAAVNYSAQCLIKPESLLTDSFDPQPIQIKHLLENKAQLGTLTVLDFGAGKGRFIKALANSENIETIRNKLDVLAYDVDGTNKELLESVFEQLYPRDANRFYSDLDSLNHKRFDIILMCNVLHEIHPSDWVSVFEKLRDLLNPNGSLWIAECTSLPIGEMAHQDGFLVLDRSAISILFVDNNIGEFTSTTHEFVKIYIIQGTSLQNISIETVLNSVKSVRSTATSKIRALRNSGSTYKKGVEFAFWCHQFVNASQIVDEFNPGAEIRG
jgi:SAM-dependent methyltransferase